jgi:peptidoglycan/LPS O-acetylase OafA/YrhL
MAPADRSQEGTASRDHAVLLDLLRALASVGVLLVHTRGVSLVELGALPPGQQTFLVKVVLALTRSGREAVLTFFVLSGYLVGGQLIRRVMRGDFNVTDYAIDRCSRILLPLIPACLVTAAINVFLLNTPDSPWNVIGSMVGLNGVVVLEPEHNAALWTLAYEIWFYILGGALAYLIATYRQRVSLMTVFILGLSVLVFTILRAQLLLFWMLGGLMALCVRMPYRKSIGLLGIVIALVGAYFFEIALPSHYLQQPAVVPAENAGEAIFVVGICLLLPACAGVRVRAGSTALIRAVGFAGSISYSLYLIHTPVLFALQRFLPKASVIDAQSLGSIGLRLGVVLLVTLVFYWLFERNTLALRRYLKRRMHPALVLASASN